MEETRIEKLFENNKDKFSGDLKSFYENFKYYNTTTTPQLLVVSVNSQKQNEIAQYFDKNNVEYDLKFINSEEDDKTLNELKKKIIFSDCVIVYSSALKIAPEGLYEICEYLSKFRKKTYFLIGGWNQIQKTEQKVAEKLNRITEQMPFLDMAKAIAVYSGENYPYLMDYKSGVEATLNFIFAKYDVLRHEQEEEIFNYGRTLVSKELKQLNKQYVQELVSVSDLQTYTYSKMNGYEIVLRNSSVDFTDLANKLNAFFNERIPSSYISYFNLSDYEPSKYGLCEKKIKDGVKDRLNDFFTDSDKLPKVDVKNKIEAIKNECQKEMSFLYSEFAKLKSVSKEDINKIQDCVDNLKQFDDFNNDLTASFSKELDNIKKLLNDKIDSASGDYKDEAIKEGILGRINKIRSLTNIAHKDESEKNEGSEKTGKEALKIETKDKNQYDNQNESQEETTDSPDSQSSTPQVTEESTDTDALRKETKAQDFCDVIIDDIKTTAIRSLDIMIHDSNDRFKEISKHYIDNYFTKILTCIEEINKKLAELQKESKVNV